MTSPASSLEPVELGEITVLVSSTIAALSTMDRTQLPENSPTCDHMEMNGMFEKRTIKILKPTKESSTGLATKSIQLPQPCPLCSTVLQLWKSYGETCGAVYHKTSDQAPADHESIRSNISWVAPNKSPRDRPSALDREDSEVNVSLEAAEYGEAYQVLIYALLRSSKSGFSVAFKDAQGDIGDIINLFRWYGVPLQSIHPGQTSDSKKQVTTELCRIFKHHQSRPREASGSGEGQAAGKLKDNTSGSNQVELFEYIRTSLGGNESWKDCIDSDNDMDHNLLDSYFLPSYAAKFWLNRYFRLTGLQLSAERRGSASNKLPQRRSISRERAPHNWPKLPKSDAVERIAVIHIRRTPKTEVARIMDEPNLIHVCRSIRNANKAARAAKVAQFSHVLLYGDFDYSNAHHLKAVAEENAQDAAATINVGFISSPWKKASGPFTEDSAQVEELWQAFRLPNTDYLPLQVKTLSIWTALCTRYHPKLCVIGHRSGFIESAALIGIPTFYLNNERWSIAKGKDYMSAGDVLWKPIKNPEHDRLRSFGDTMNTFIAIEVLIDPNPEPNLVRKQQPASKAKATPKKKEIESQSKDKQKSGSIKIPFRARKNGPGIQDIPEKLINKEPLQVQKGYQNELAAALFIYMCCNVAQRHPRRLADQNIAAQSETESEKLLGWQDRCCMMHDNDRTKKLLRPGHASAVCGQEWLEDRYKFAVNAIDGRKVETAKFLPLPDWLVADGPD
jgi:hypothetical protein